ncbi:MAG: TAXI family TRAP transporter solute-binding subunit [Dehalobacterium sp.]
MKKTKLITLVVLTLGLLLFTAACGKNETGSSDGTENKEQVSHLKIGTASVGGAFYPIGTGIADIITKNIPGVDATAEVTGGGVENVRLVGEKEDDIGLSAADQVFYGHEGIEMFNTKYDIASMAALYPSVLQIYTLDKSPINSINDLKGKNVAVGPAGGGTAKVLEMIFEFYGMKIDDIKTHYISYEEGSNALVDGTVDAAMVMSGFPASAIMELQATHKVKLIPIEEDILNQINGKYPFLLGINVPKDVYDTANDTMTISRQTLLFCRSDLNEDLVYQITKAIFDNLEEFKKYHPSLADTNLDDAVNVSIPMHPGAEKYFTEKGIN